MLNTLFRRRPLIEELEPRLLFSADLAPVAIDSLQAVPEQRMLDANGEFAAVTTASQARQELVIIDSRVGNLDALLADLNAQSQAGRRIDVVVLDPNLDGIAQITAALQNHGQIDALHIISHGENGQLQLGSTWVDSTRLNAQSSSFQAWDGALTADADILLYGCDVAEGETGQQFVQTLSSLTGADVAASTDQTGSATQSGDWVLEAQTGHIETTVAIDAAGQAAWDGVLGNEFMVNQLNPNDQNTASLNRGSQQAVAYDAAGDFVVVWTSKSQDGDGYGVYARRFAADGTPLTDEFLVNSTTTNDQTYASVVSDNAGNFVVTWTSQNQDGSGLGVYVRRFAADGTPLTGEIKVNTTTAGDQSNSVISINRTSGEFVVAWQGAGPGDAQGIFFRRFAADGSALDASDQRANLTDSGNEQNPAVAMDSSGRFVIVYEVSNHMYFQRFNQGGGAQGGRVQVDNGFSTSTGAAIAMDGSGNFTIVYREQNILTGIWGRGYYADGTQRYSWFQPATGDSSSPSIAMDASGAFVVTYQKTGVNGQDIYARKYNADASSNGSAFIVNQYTNSDQVAPSTAMLDMDHYVVVWSGKSASDSNAVSARIFTPPDTTAPVITSNGGGDTASLSIAENTTAVTTVTASDADGPVQTLTYSISGGADAAMFTVSSATGALGFVTAPNFEAPADSGGNNVYDVTVQVSDGTLTDTQAITVTVTDANEAPVASDDLYATNQNTTLTVPAGTGLIANDSDPENDTLSVISASTPTHGTLSLNPSAMTVFTNLTNNGATDTRADWSPDGSKIAFDTNRDGNNEIYVMNADGTGLVRMTNNSADDSQAAWSPDGSKITFMSNRSGTYEIWVMNASDGSGLTQLTNVGGSTVSGQPVWSPDGSKIAFTSDRAGGSGFEIYVMDANGANVTRLTSASGDDSEPVWSPDGSKIAFYSNRDGNTEIYVMNADGMGQTRLTSNGGIDRSPVWSLDGSKIAFISNRSGTNQIYIMDANGSNQTAVTSVPSAVTFPDWSPDGQKLLFTYNNEIQTANVNFDGAFIYTPNAGYTGSDSFTYTIIDGNGHTSVATVSINVNLVNVAPITTLVALTSIAEDNGPRLITQAELLVNAIDLNGDSLSATGLAISSGSGTLLDNGNGTWTYTSAINDNSSVSFIYTVSDGSLTAPGSATLDITPVNDAPTAANDTVNATEDTLYSGTLPAANDVDGDPLSYALSGQAAQGTVAVNAGGTFSYTPNANFNGTDSFSYTVSDDNGGSNTYVVTVNVAPVNDASVANNDAHSGSEDTTINGDVLANDSDVEGDSLTAALVSGPAHGALTLNSDGSFIFTPNTNWSGTDTFSYKANDGTQDSTIATVTLTVSPVNDAPSFTSPAATMATEDVPFSYSITTADPDTGASLIITAPILPAWLTLTDNGDGTATLSGTPTNAEVGSHSVVLQVSDGSLSASQSFTITVSNANDAPTASNSSFGTLEDTSQSGLLPVATDIDGDPVTYSLNTAASYGVTVVNADGSYTYTPNANYYGSDSFTFMVSDGQGGSNAYSVSVSVTSVNDAPSGTNNTVSVNEDTTYTFHTSDFGFSDPNDTPANSMLAVKIISLPSAGTLLYEGTAVATGQLIDASDIAGDELRFVPATNANGTGYANFTFQVKDNGGTANGGINFDPTPRTLTIDVTPVNDTPSFSSTAVTTATEDSAYSYNIATIDLDTGASLIITAPTLPAWLTLTDHGDGTATLSGTPTNAEVGSHGVVLQVSDGGLSATQGFTLTVNNVNNAPTAGNASFSTLEDTPLSGLLPPATDIDGDPVTYGPNTPASHGVAVVNASGGYTYTPNANYAGSDSFAFTIVDGSGGSNTYVVTLNVTPINDAPVLSTNLPSIEPGQTHVIATSELQATDPDNTATQLNYVLTSAPANGTLTLNGLALVLNNTFTQADVDSGRISYTNTNTASTSDAFAVSVTDTQGAATPNTPIVFLINQPVAPPVDAGAPVAPLPAPTLPPAEVAPELPATPPAAEPDAPASEAAPELAPIPLATTPADEQSAGNEAGPVSAAGRSASAPAGAHMMQSAYLQTISLTLPKAGSESATPLLSSLVRALDAISTDTHAMEALQVSLGNNSFQQQLNSLQNDINHQLHLDKTTVASSLVVSTGLSVGYVLWLVRGGVLLSSLLSTLPAWRLIDPLPILGYLDRGKRGSDEDDSLEGMLKKSADRDAAVGKPPVSGESVEPTNRAP